MRFGYSVALPRIKAHFRLSQSFEAMFFLPSTHGMAFVCGTSATRQVFTVVIRLSPSGEFQIDRVDTMHGETIDLTQRRHM